MSKQKCRIYLPQQTHSVRTAQAVLQYGAGAMVDFPDQTLVTAAPELWSKTQRIYDERLAKALHVSYFARRRSPIRVSRNGISVRSADTSSRSNSGSHSIGSLPPPNSGRKIPIWCIVHDARYADRICSARVS